MLKQTIIWTALPNGTEGSVVEGATLHLSAHVSPRLWNDDPSVVEMTLGTFPDFLDWPAKVAQTTFEVEFSGGSTVTATADFNPLRSDLWQALFRPTTVVVPFVFEDLAGAEIKSFPAAVVHDTIKQIYQRAATDPAYGAGGDLPSRERLSRDRDLNEIARPVRPEPPHPPDDRDRRPVWVDEPADGEPPAPEPEEPDRGYRGCVTAAGCAGCLFLLLRVGLWLFRRLFRGLGVILLLPLGFLFGFPAAERRFSPNGVGGGGGSSPKKDAFDQLNHYLAPTSATSEPLPDASDLEETFDFHRMVSSLGDYPSLLRRMGLVIDLTVTVPAGGWAATGTVRVLPTLPLSTPTTNYSPRTHYELAADRFLPRPRASNEELNAGLLRLHDTARYRVQHVDTAGGGVKLQNTATNLVGTMVLGTVPANSSQEEGLPALQTAGISVVMPETTTQLTASFQQSYALNSALAAVDGSPVKTFAGSGVAPPPDDSLFAEDLVRGYRIDVWDDRSSRWHSLCRRIGTYEFLEPADGGAALVLSDVEDEGFVQVSATEPLTPGAPQVLRVHESLFTWDGWSLCAPRPGDAILPDHTTGPVENAPATPFKMVASFRHRPGSLPRLRFGYEYRLRGRMVDLAGNSIFGPDDPVFQTTPPEASPPFPFRRFEPVGPPPVLLRAVPKEGESLEHLTVRSSIEDPPATIAALATERHLAPPKSAQLLAERHGRFDGATEMLGDATGYDLASREAGSLTERVDLTTGDLEPIPGISEISDPTQNRTYWLQTNATFDVSYLPDPYARGVLLLGLPGMLTPETITDGVNRIPLDGTWPDLKPLRLRLRGIPAGIAPAPPEWDETDRLLTVQLPQGETAKVRISSYFHAEDLLTMGVWGWTEEAAPPDLADLRQSTIEGRNWLHLPFRELLLTHAVQQPLKIPKFSQLTIAPARPLGESTISLSGTLTIDGKSTGKVDVWADWADPVDDPSDPTNDPRTAVGVQRMHVEELSLSDPADDAPTLAGILQAMGDPNPAVRQTFADLKYHRVGYTPIASTRFREHFPPSVLADPDNLIRPRPSEAAIPEVLDVPNAARPAPPVPQYVLPSFRWAPTEAAGIRTRGRQGGGIRIYLERPWFSSGAGELLGVLIRQDSAPLSGDAAETLRKYTSEWGRDPLWQAGGTAPLRVSDFANPTKVEQNLPLAELPGQAVHVVGFEPRYDADDRRWVVDLHLDVAARYFPFVRLALVRYQPISVAGAHLSTVVLADLVQVLPHRTVDYDLTDVAPNRMLPVRVRGPAPVGGGAGFDISNAMIARLERRQHGDSAGEEPVGWEPIATIYLEATAAGLETEWKGEIPLPDPLPHPLRVSILEVEIYRTDGRPVLDILSVLQGATAVSAEGGHSRVDSIENQDLGYRVVFADATVVG